MEHGKYMVCLLLLASLVSCQNDTAQGRNSIEGNWRLTKAETFFSTGSDTTVREEGVLGQFVFDEDSVTYNFTRNDSLFAGSERWYLVGEKVNDGFFRVNKFTLVVQDNFTFICRFGDQTKNAERGATDITLSTNLAPNPDFYYMLSLEKE